MKYKIAIAGFLFFLLGFLLASKAYEFICSCPSPDPAKHGISEYDPCYQCMLSQKYQNMIIFFQLMMIVSIFIVLYGFFTEFEYGKK